jgi:chorismate mutase
MAEGGIRGAITIDDDNAEEVLDRTRELLATMVGENSIAAKDIASALFTVTPDIKSEFPARAARSMGWNLVPLMCFQEIEVEGSMPRCIRVLLHVNTTREQNQIKHIYLRDAAKLREDLHNS